MTASFGQKSASVFGFALVLGLMPACKDGEEGGDDEVGDGDSDAEEEGEDGSDSDTGDGDGDDGYQPVPGGMRRMLDYQFTNSIEMMFGPEAAAVANPPSDVPLHGYKSIGAAEVAPGLDSVELYEGSALAIADAAIANPTTLAGIVPCIQGSPDDACYTEVAQKLGHLAWRRPLTDAEVASVVDIAQQAKAWGEGDFYAGLKYELVRLLVSPHFIYVSELGTPDPVEPGEFWLTGPELVTRMSLLLNGRIPNLQVLEQAESGMYDDEAAVEQLARAMLQSPEAETAIGEFFGEYLTLGAIPGKSSEVFPLYSEALVASMQQETQLLLDNIVWETNGDFRLFLDADFTYVDANLAAVYGVTPPEGGDWTQVQLPAEQNRAGFLTHASFLARNSHVDGNSTTRRGQYIQQRFMCFSVPPPPVDVVPEIPEIPEGQQMTLRQVMEQLHLSDPEGNCYSCHVDLDMPAFPLEHFDAIGAYRTLDNGLPVDPVVEYGPWGLLENASDLAASVAMDPRLTDCVVNNVIRFGRGRLEDPQGEPTELLALYDQFETSGYRVQELLVQLVLETAGNAPLHELVRAYILQPLGLNHTYTQAFERAPDDSMLVTGYSDIDGNGLPEDVSAINDGFGLGDGSLNMETNYHRIW
ncbi:MAG: DUF1592 domain-containing protein [Deltaproteobacteria bacterium]|nr:DUF1592 domain-containing protein [Deltaproteobacteria bacterium]